MCKLLEEFRRRSARTRDRARACWHLGRSSEERGRSAPREHRSTIGWSCCGTLPRLKLKVLTYGGKVCNFELFGANTFLYLL
jgi:hypothetical protein